MMPVSHVSQANTHTAPVIGAGKESVMVKTNMPYKDLTTPERRKRARQVWEARKRGAPRSEILRQYRLSVTTFKIIMQHGGDWPPADINNNLADVLPENPPPISMQAYTMPTNLNIKQIRKPLLYFNACPRGCGGTVHMHPEEAKCIHCGWAYYGKPNLTPGTSTHRVINGQRMQM